MFHFICKNCGKSFLRSRNMRNIQFCSRPCHAHWHHGHEDVVTYRRKYATRINGQRMLIQEHVLLAEKALGREMPKGAEVHHLDGNYNNNTPANLVICESSQYHRLLEARLRQYRDTGSLNLKR